SVKPPPKWHLVDSNEGDEPARVSKEFADKTDWRTIPSEFLDRSPGGLHSALSFLSDEAFLYYLQAYMIADLKDELENVDLVFHLTHGLSNTSMRELVNERRYGARTWFDYAKYKFSVFNSKQRAVIVKYLRYKADKDEIGLYDESIEQALKN